MVTAGAHRLLGLSKTIFGLVAFAIIAVSFPAESTDETIQGNVYTTDSVNFVNASSLEAGQTYVIDFLFNDQATNATLGNFLGFCVALRSDGLSQCQYTVQLAAGTFQTAGLESYPPGPPYNPLSYGLWAITGGTGLYTGASGYYEQVYNPKLGSGPGKGSDPGVPSNGIIIKVNY